MLILDETMLGTAMLRRCRAGAATQSADADPRLMKNVLAASNQFTLLSHGKPVHLFISTRLASSILNAAPTGEKGRSSFRN